MTIRMMSVCVCLCP